MHTKLPQKPQTIEISKLFPIIENDLAHFFLHAILSQILWFYGVYGKLWSLWYLNIETIYILENDDFMV